MEDSSALTMLEEVTTVESRQDVAMTLVKIYLGQGLVVPFLDYLNTREVNQTSKIDLLQLFLVFSQSCFTVKKNSNYCWIYMKKFRVTQGLGGHWFNQFINQTLFTEQ